MTTEKSNGIVDRAKRIYAERLQAELEVTHPNAFVAIEPESGEHFISDTFSRAVANARKAHPERISFVVRVGHRAAIHIGGMIN